MMTTSRHEPLEILTSRAMLLLSWLVIFAAVLLWYARDRWLAVVTTAVIELAIVTLWALCAWLLGRSLLPKREITQINPALAFSTATAIGLGVISLAALLLGLAGLLNRYTALALLLIGPLLHLPQFFNLLKTTKNIPFSNWLLKPATFNWILLYSAPLIAIMITAATILPGILWKPDDPHPYDALEYHLQVPREWMEAGKITPLHHNVFSYFPFNVEMQYLTAMHIRGGPWAAMYQCQFTSILWTILTAIALYGYIKNNLANHNALALAVPLLALSTPWTLMLGAVAYTESALAFYAVMSVIWMLQAVKKDQQNIAPKMLIAGALTGIACGVKYTAIPMLFLPLGVAAFAVALATRQLRAYLKPLSLYTAIAAAVVSPWLIRNVIWTGNPVFPLAMKQFGKAHFDTVQVERFNRAHSPTPAQAPLPARISRFTTEVFTSWQFGYILWIAVALSAFFAFQNRFTWLILIYLTIVAFVWIFFTHLLGRFFVLTIPISALLITLPRPRWWPVAAMTLAAVSSIICFTLLQPRMKFYGELVQAGFVGLEDTSILAPPDLAAAETTEETVTLVGDAQAFLYNIPTRRLKYKTVFDIPANQPDMWTAWTGLPESKATGTFVLNPMEVDRLSKTYLNIPGLPQHFPWPKDQTSTVRKK